MSLSTTSPLISVVIPAKDAADTLPRVLACVGAQELGGAYEVLVVDDNSSDGTAAIVAEAGPPVRLVPGAGRGAAEARNLGAAEAAAPLLAFTDADCFPPPGWLAAGSAALRDAELVQGAVEPDPQAPAEAFDHTIVVAAESGLFETANLFVSTELFRRLGGFEDVVDANRAQGRFGEDVWLGWRARRRGARIAFAPAAVTHHARIRRSGKEYAAERLRLRHFPGLVAAIPELRAERGTAWVFLSRHTAAFDLALAAVVLAALRRSPAFLVGALPYAAAVLRGVGLSRWAPRLAAVELAADAVGLASLVRGSVEARTLLL